MTLAKEPDTEPIPGYRLIAFLGQGGFGEVWKCEAPGGLLKAIKFVHGNLNALDVERLQAEQEWKALQHIKNIRHPFLLGIDLVQQVDGELLIVTELADCSLLDVLRAYQQKGKPGIPREELMGYMREAAEALDLINLQHQLQHLDVKPANLFLVNHHVKVGDFGLVNTQGETDESRPLARAGGMTPLYSAPETLQGQVSSRSDQFSLGVVYQELLTGRPPFGGKNPREVMLRRASEPPNLDALPAAERPIVGRALSLDPEQRFGSCTAFVHTLAPDLMPRHSTPLLEMFLGEPAAVPLPSRAGNHGTRPDLSHPTLPLAPDRHPARPGRPRRDRPAEEPRANNDGGFPGYSFLKCLAHGQLSEIWKVQGPNGRLQLLKCPCGLTSGSAPAEAKAVQFLASLDHPGLLKIETVRSATGRIAFVSEMIEGTLADRLQHCQTMGLPGIPGASCSTIFAWPPALWTRCIGNIRFSTCASIPGTWCSWGISSWWPTWAWPNSSGCPPGYPWANSTAAMPLRKSAPAR